VSARADILFYDSFDRANNNNIDAVTTGITGTVGSMLSADGVYTSPWVDPNNLTGADTSAANGGGQRINNNRFEKYNAGTANLFVNHNFNDAAILAAGGFSVSLDVTAVTQSGVGQGAVIAVGMSQTEAGQGKDANDGSPGSSAPGVLVANQPTRKYSNAFQNTNFTTLNGGAVLADFYFALRADGTVAWGVGGSGTVPAPTSTSVGSKTGTISATFTLNSFAAGSTVNYALFYNNTPVTGGTGTFTWSESDANYIGIDARDGGAPPLVQMDNFIISTIPEASSFLAMGTIALGLGCVVAVKRRRQRA
jgi:hypothetical protein